MYPQYFPCHKAHGGNIKAPVPCFDDRVNKVRRNSQWAKLPKKKTA